MTLHPRRAFLLSASLLASTYQLLANAANGDPRLERLFSSFIAPCCWRENLLVHSSPKADELRAEIRQQIAAGKTDEEIKASFLGRYSTRILAMPEGAKGHWLNWTPWLLASAGLAAVVTLLRRSPQPAAPTSTPENLPDLPDSEWD
jgi:cytochrome c-type biogenesis protein CcmH